MHKLRIESEAHRRPAPFAMSSPPAARLRAQLDAGPLRTARLALRLPRAEDAALVYHGYATDTEAIRWMGFHAHTSVTDAEAVVSNWVANWDRGAGALALMMEQAADGRFLGVVDLDWNALAPALLG